MLTPARSPTRAAISIPTVCVWFCSVSLRADLTATLDYGYGGVLDLTRPDVQLQEARQSLSTVRRHAVAGKLSGRVPRLQDALDDLVRLGQRTGPHPCRYVQFLARTIGPVSQRVCPAASARICFPSRPHGSHARPQEPDGAGLRSGDGPGRPHGVLGAARPLCAWWSCLHILRSPKIKFESTNVRPRMPGVLLAENYGWNC